MLYLHLVLQGQSVKKHNSFNVLNILQSMVHSTTDRKTDRHAGCITEACTHPARTMFRRQTNWSRAVRSSPPTDFGDGFAKVKCSSPATPVPIKIGKPRLAVL